MRRLTTSFVVVVLLSLFASVARAQSDAGRFAQVMLQVVGKRLTYRVLTAKDDAGFMGIR